MFASVANRFSAAQEFRLRKAAAPFVLLAGTLAIYALLHALLIAVAESNATNCLGLDAIALIAAGMFSGMRYAEIPFFARPLLRGIGAVVLVQVAFDVAALYYGSNWMLAGVNGAFFRLGGALALMAGVAALWRPSFILPLLFHYVALRHQQNILSGVTISETDYLSMLDIGVFLSIGTLLVVTVTRANIASRLLPSWLDAEWLRVDACTLIVVWAIGAHFGNYFISGWTKIRTGGDDPLFWVMHNPT